MNRSSKKMKIEGNGTNVVNSSRKTGYSMIHSGHYMTSCLHDNENDDDTVEMPIASPDATNNEVTAAAAEIETSASVKSASSTALASGTTNEQTVSTEDVSEVTSVKDLSKSEVVSETNEINCELGVTHDLVQKNRRLLLRALKGVKRPNAEGGQFYVSGEDQNRIAMDANSKNGGISLINGSWNNKISFENIQDAMANARKSMFALLCAQQGSISGGLTLDKANKSLMKLIFYIKTSFSNNLTSPKWKNFKGLKLQVTEKIRINNVIWRSWFEQFGIKDSSKRKRRLVCQFSSGIDDTSTSNTVTISTACSSLASSTIAKTARENKFWKARLESITNEYKKWRELSRKQIKATNNIDGPTISITVTKTIPINIPNKNSGSGKSESIKSSSYQSDQIGVVFDDSAIHSSTSGLNSITTTVLATSTLGNTPSLPAILNNTPIMTNTTTQSIQNSSTNSNYFFSNQGYGTSVGNEILNNDSPIQSSSNSTSENFSNYQNSSVSAFSNYGQNAYSNITASPNFTLGINSVGTVQTTPLPSANHGSQLPQHHNSPIANKQIPYNNRCRSPSPGLYQDIDLYNFSSDTLFSTYLVEDTKDPVFGTNPDFFQPDLMHLYPNFDFFELCDNDFMSTTTNISSTGTSKAEVNKSNSTESNGSIVQSIQPAQQPQSDHLTAQESFGESQQTNGTSVSIHSAPNFSRSQSSNYEQQAHLQNIENLSLPSSIAESNQNTSGASSRKYGSLDYSVSCGLSNFDTLVSVATAQSPATAQKIVQPSVNIQENSAINYSNKQVSNQLTNTISTNTIRNLLSMTNSTNNSEIIKPHRLTINKQYDIGNSEAQELLPETSVSSTVKSTVNSMHVPIMNNMSMQISAPNVAQSMINNPVVSSLSQMLEKNNSSLSNKSKGLFVNNNVNENNQTINSLLAVLTASSTVANSSSLTSSHSQPASIESIEAASAIKNIRNRKNTDTIKSPVNSRRSTSQSKSTSIKGISKKDLKFGLSNNEQINEIDNLNEEIVSVKPSINSNLYQRQQQAISHNQQISSSVYDLIVNQSGTIIPASISTTSCENGNRESSAAIGINNTTTNSPNSNTNSQYSSQFMNNLAHTPQELSSQSSTTNMVCSIPSNTISNESNDFLIGNLTVNSNSKTCNSYSSINSVATVINGVVPSVGSSRINRSNSVSSVNTMSETNLNNAEQKRRCNIQHGFDRLQVLVPALLDGKNAKVSKAVMLQKTSEHIKELQTAREKRLNDLSLYKRELEELSDKIAVCQSQLPASGVAVTGQLNKIERFEQKFTSYVKERTMENWRFYIFSLILRPLFETFLSYVTTASKEDMERTFTQWQQKSCNLTHLRPVASTALRHLVKSTTILTDASHLPEECLAAVLPKI